MSVHDKVQLREEQEAALNDERASHHPLSRREVIRRLCRLQEEAARHVGAQWAADCFCQEGGLWGCTSYNDQSYRNDGAALAFIEEAVRGRIAEENGE